MRGEGGVRGEGSGEGWGEGEGGVRGEVRGEGGVRVGLVHVWYSGTCLRWSLCWTATSLKQPAYVATDSTKPMQSISVEQPPLYKGHLGLSHRWLSQTGSTVLQVMVCVCGVMTDLPTILQ